jgi:hypothetical protein
MTHRRHRDFARLGRERGRPTTPATPTAPTRRFFGFSRQSKRFGSLGSPRPALLPIPDGGEQT